MGSETILTLFWFGTGLGAMTSQEYKSADACNAAGIAMAATTMAERVGKLRFECTDKYTGALRTTAGKR